MKTLLTAASAFALVSLSSPAMAQATADEEPTTKAALQQQLDTNYQRLDANKDGSVSRAEIEAAQAEVTRQAQKLVEDRMVAEFTRLDANKDGNVSLAEFKAAAPTARAGTVDQFLGRFDGNKDGRVTPSEYKAPALAAFDTLDGNKDGTLTPQERQAAESR